MFEYNDVEGRAALRLSAAARADLQCNIINSTKRVRSLQLFVRFDTVAAFRDWLATTPAVTREADRGASDRDVNLLFTAQGLAKLGAPLADIAAADPAFARGARHPQTRELLRDPDPANWPNHEHIWDAALLIHSDSDAVGVNPPARGEFQIERGNSIGADGMPLNDPRARRFNHFGYVEGLSAIYYEDPPDGLPAMKNYDPRRRLSTVLVRDPYARAPSSFGSFFVFRKYAMNRAAFDLKVQNIARAIQEREADPNSRAAKLTQRFPEFRNPKTREELEELVRAWLMGRYPDGRPLVAPNEIGNDFTLDAAGVQCPFHAHIAKMNPRGRTGDLDSEHRATIARCGISYGNRDSPEKGLLFWCAQASIAKQFEFVQQQWANDQDVDLTKRATPDLDNVIGKRVDPQPFEFPVDPYPNMKRYDRWKDRIDQDFGVYDTITLQGAEYLFAPSVSGVENLKAITTVRA